MDTLKAPPGQVAIRRVDVITRNTYPAGCFPRSIAVARLDRLNKERKGVTQDYFIAVDDEGKSVKGSVEPEVLDVDAQ